jgi:hypothetical protein
VLEICSHGQAWSNVAIIFGLTVYAPTNCEKSEIVVAGIDGADVSCSGFGLKVGHHQPAKAMTQQVPHRWLLMARSGGSLRRSDTSAIGGIADLPGACLKRLS